MTAPPAASSSPPVPGTRVVAPRAGHRHEALGVGTGAPRLSWRTETRAPGWTQAAYEVELVDPATGRVERSGRLPGDDSVLVPWWGPPLRSRERRAVRVRVWRDRAAEPSPWSDPLTVEAGLLEPSDWTAVAVGAGDDDGAGGPATLLRREVVVRDGLRRARLYVTALGVLTAEVNGVRVGDEVLAPGWTSYRHRLRYRVHDVTDALVPGRNAIGATVADGWYRGRFGFDHGRENLYGDRTALLAQLELEYADGSRETVATDRAWRSAPSAVRTSTIYDGETLDARLDRPGWSLPGFDDAGWAPVRVVPLDPAVLVAADGPPVRRTAVLDPAEVTHRSPTVLRVDVGQNVVGRLQVTARGPRGSWVRMRHAEVLEHGELATRPLRHARATDLLVLDGEPRTWEPEFTFHGFRYAELETSGPDVEVTAVRAVVVHSDLRRTGDFACSDPDVTRLFANAVWGLRGNAVDVPTDCPQRDERLGWTGDLAVFAPAATGMYDCAGFLTSWLADLAADQAARPDGLPPLVSPDVLSRDFPAAVWGDAVVVVPWTLYERYGDPAPLAALYDGMCRWVTGVRDRSRDGVVWDTDWQLGDWLDPTAPADDPAAGGTSGALVATAWYARSAILLGRVAAVLGHDDDAATWTALGDAVRAAFVEEYVTGSGLLASDSQTAYALALVFDLIPDPRRRRRAGARLVELVHAARYRIRTGFVGTALVTDALVLAGAPQVAYRLLAERGCPSFLYPLTMGATTVWERWDSMLPDGSVNPGEMTSFNHAALGSVADWLQRTVAGLGPAAPGYRRLRVAPVPGGPLTHAAAELLTPYGPAGAGWRRDGDELVVTATVPPNTAADVELPDGTRATVGSGAHTWHVPWTAAAYPPPVPPVVVMPPVAIEGGTAPRTRP